MPYTQIWEIQDSGGTIHSGREIEMKTAFDVMTIGNVDVLNECLNIPRKEISKLIEKYQCEWKGDLRLVQIHEIHK